MKIRFAQTDWLMLRRIANSIRFGSDCPPKERQYRTEIQKKVMEGIADAILAEMAGEPADGQVTFSLDLKIERFNIPTPRPTTPSYSLLAELDDILNKKKPQDLIEW
jgi:hypothetical protein